MAQWRTQRDELQAQLDSDDDTEPMSYDADAIIAELDELEEHLTGDSSSLAKAAFQRVFESITLYWEKVSPRRRELVRAEIVPRFPFCLTVNTLSLQKNFSPPHPALSPEAVERVLSLDLGQVVQANPAISPEAVETVLRSNLCQAIQATRHSSFGTVWPTESS